MWIFHFIGGIRDEIRVSSNNDGLLLKLLLIVFYEFGIIFLLAVCQRLRHQIDDKATVLNAGGFLVGFYFLAGYAVASEITIVILVFFS